MKQIKMFYSVLRKQGEPTLEEKVNVFCKKVNVVDVKFSETVDGTGSDTTIMVIYEA